MPTPKRLRDKAYMAQKNPRVESPSTGAAGRLPTRRAVPAQPSH